MIVGLEEKSKREAFDGKKLFFFLIQGMQASAEDLLVGLKKKMERNGENWQENEGKSCVKNAVLKEKEILVKIQF
jgi:hypothetical protein